LIEEKYITEAVTAGRSQSYVAEYNR